MLGQSGAGKSSIGNQILKNENAFKPAPLGSPESMTDRIDQSQSCFGDLALIMFDTQGMGDTKGRSIKFLDDIVTAIKKEKPHGLMFVINGGTGSKFGPDVKNALRCFAQCLKPSGDSDLGLPDGRVLLIVNHLASDDEFGGPFSQGGANKAQVLADAANSANANLAAFLESSQLPFEHVFGVQKNDRNLDQKVQDIHAAIRSLPDEPLDVGQFRTFASVMKEATDLRNNAVNASDYAARKIDQVKYDIAWHQRRIRDCKIANAATCWIPFANVATTIGFVSAIADSESKIPGLQSNLAEIEKNKEQVLDRAKRKAEAWLTEMADLKKAMDTK